MQVSIPENDDDEEQVLDLENLETVPLTPHIFSSGDSASSSAASSSQGSFYSHHAAGSYLQYFRSPASHLPTSSSKHDTSFYTADNRTRTPLYPVPEQLQPAKPVPVPRVAVSEQDEEEEEEEDTEEKHEVLQSYVVPDAYQVHHEKGRRESLESVRSSASVGSRPSSVRSNASIGSSRPSSVRSNASSTSSSQADGLSMISSMSHLFGEGIPSSTSFDDHYPNDTAVERGSTSYSATLPLWNHLTETMRQRIHRPTRMIHWAEDVQARLQGPPLSPHSKQLADLDYLVSQHKQKVQQLEQTSPEEHHGDFFDFCLVLQPQEMYAFWASLLDFRVELLGPDAVQDMDATMGVQRSPPTSETQTSTNEDSNEEQAQEEDAGSEALDILAEIATPMTGMRRRASRTPLTTLPGSSRRLATPEPGLWTPRMPGSAWRSSPFSVADSSRLSVRTRQSLFERAVGATPAVPSTAAIRRPSDVDESMTSALDTTPGTVTSRRRWGNQLANNPNTSVHLSTPQVTSPKSIRRRTVPRLTLSKNTTTSTLDPTQQKQYSDLPRGIAARNDILPFLNALKQGIVVRRHRPGQEVTLCRIRSSDGGDTIQYEHLEHSDAMEVLAAQRTRYNKLKDGMSPRDIAHAPWSIDHDALSDENSPAHNFSVPDYVLATRYREKHQREQGLPKKVVNLAQKVAQSGTIKAHDIVAVHPAIRNDPRSKDGNDKATASLRRSKSEHSSKHSFSLVLRAPQRFAAGNPQSIEECENKWFRGEGSESQFKYVDFEAATLGEYWLIFRGFLLLHRDAVVGRFAEQRAAGIGSHYNRLELEQREQADKEDHNRLHRDEFHEPITVGCLEKMIVKCRDLDTTYMEGFTLPGARPPPSDYFLGFRSAGTQIWSRLRQAGFETQRVYSLDPRRVMIKVRCPSDRLMDVAEVLRVKLKTRKGTYASFREDSMDIFQPMDDPLEMPPIYDRNDFLFRSSIRQDIIDFVIGSRIRDSGAGLGQRTELGKMIQARVPLHMHGKLNQIYDAWVPYWHVENWIGRDGKSMSHKPSLLSSKKEEEKRFSFTTVASQDDEESKDQKIPNRLQRFITGSLYQPLDSIEDYFGEKVAFYFALVQHTATHLVFLSCVGLFVFFLQLSVGWDHWLRPVFSVVVMLWTFVVLVNWKKRANFLAYRWGTMNYREQETTRAQFHGTYAKDEITGEWIVVYPKWKRWLKYCISFPLTLLFTAGSLVLIMWVHSNRDLQLSRYMEQKTNPDTAFQFDLEYNAIGLLKKKPPANIELTKENLRDPTFWFIVCGLPALLGLCLPLVNFVLMKLSVMLNDFENYRTHSEYRTHLIIKVFSFRFVCYFATLYYYAFVSVGTKEAIQNGILRVGTGVLVYTTVAYWWQLFLHVFFPILIRKFRMNHRDNRLRDELRDIELEEEEITQLLENASDNDLKKRQVVLINKRLLLEQAQDDIWLEVMLPQHDSFPEYINAVVQFTYVSCFSVVLPITPLICMINFLVSMRLDAYKLCKGRRRPLAEKTGGIGVWEHLLNIVAVISILTNCWLIGFTSSTFLWIGEQIGEVGLFAIVVCWEHVMLLIKYIMDTAISPLPKSVRDAMKREKFEQDQQQNLSLRNRNYQRRSQHQRESDASTTNDVSEDQGVWRRDVSSTAKKSLLHTIPSADDDIESQLAVSCSSAEEQSPSMPPILSSNHVHDSDASNAESLQSEANAYTPPLLPGHERTLFSA